MPVNKSEHKIRVVKLFGQDPYGAMDPAVNMQVRHGQDTRWIVSLDSGNYQVGLAISSGGTATSKAYPEHLQIDLPTASGYGWPTGINQPVQWGRQAGQFATGVPVGVGSGHTYMGGDDATHTFGR